jgi:hypothetical protein
VEELGDERCGLAGGLGAFSHRGESGRDGEVAQGVFYGGLVRRHCEERSDEAIQSHTCGPGLLRCARNDGGVGGAALRPYLLALKKSFSIAAASLSPTAEYTSGT